MDQLTEKTFKKIYWENYISIEDEFGIVAWNKTNLQNVNDYRDCILRNEPEFEKFGHVTSIGKPVATLRRAIPL